MEHDEFDPEAEGYFHIDDITEYDLEGNARDYSVWEDEDGDRIEIYEGGSSKHDITGFDDEESFEDNMV